MHSDYLWENTIFDTPSRKFLKNVYLCTKLLLLRCKVCMDVFVCVYVCIVAHWLGLAFLRWHTGVQT